MDPLRDTLEASPPARSGDDVLRRILGPLGVDVSCLGASLQRSSWNDLHHNRKVLRRSLNAVLEHARKEDRDLTADEASAWDQASRAIEHISGELDTREENGQRRPRAPGAGLSSAAGFGRHALPEGTPLARGERLADRIVGDPGEADASIGALVRASMSGDWSGVEHFRAQQSIGSGSGGGFVTPGMLSARIIDLARNQSRVAQAGASVIPVTTGTVSFGTIEEDPEAHWRAENAEIPESGVTFGSRNFQAQTIAILVRSSIELIEDGLNVDALIERTIAAQVALQLDRAALFGTGIGQPLGLFNHGNANFIDLNGPLVDYAPLSLAVQRCAEANVEAGDFVLAARTAGELDRLVDDNGNPMRPPRSVAERNLLATNQVPVDLEADVGSPPVPVENASAFFTGLWSDYYLVVRTQLMLEASRLAGDAFKKMQVLLRGYARVDGFSVRPASFAIVRGITPPAA